MAFENWSDDNVLYESDTDYYVDSDDDYDFILDNDDAYDDSSERRNKRRVSNARGARGRQLGRTNAGPYRGRGVIETPAGKAQVSLPGDLVSKKEFQELEKKVLAINKDNAANGKAIAVLNTNTKKLDDGLASQAKHTTDVKKKISGIQQGHMFSALLPPKINEITLTGDATGGTPAAPKAVPVSATRMDMMTSLLPLMVSGGMGGGSSSGSSNDNNMMMPLMLIAMNNNSGASAGTTGSNNDSMMMIVLMMMMMNNK